MKLKRKPHRIKRCGFFMQEIIFTTSKKRVIRLSQQRESKKQTKPFGKQIYKLRKTDVMIESTKGKQKTNKTLRKANLQTQKNRW